MPIDSAILEEAGGSRPQLLPTNLRRRPFLSQVLQMERSSELFELFDV